MAGTAIATLPSAPIVTLSTGLRVANFSSPHEFVFTDGSVLPKCDAGRARALMLHSTEVEYTDPLLPFTSIRLEFHLSPAVADEFLSMQNNPEIDIILVPLPVMMALKQDLCSLHKARVCRVADRVTKVIHHDRFCF